MNSYLSRHSTVIPIPGGDWRAVPAMRHGLQMSRDVELRGDWRRRRLGASDVRRRRRRRRTRRFAPVAQRRHTADARVRTLLVFSSLVYSVIIKGYVYYMEFKKKVLASLNPMVRYGVSLSIREDILLMCPDYILVVVLASVEGKCYIVKCTHFA